MRGRVRGLAPAVALVCVALAAVAGEASAARAAQVDGISDQSRPAWDGSFGDSALAGALRPPLLGADPPVCAVCATGIAFARYVVQWDALLRPVAGGQPGRSQALTPTVGTPTVGTPTVGPPTAGVPGSYAARFEAWLGDVAALGLRPVLALTSYDGAHPSSPSAYAAGLHALLARAAALGHPIALVEPWNEPNNQGDVTAPTAAAYADAAHAACPGCTLIAGDFEDRAGAADYARAYARALTFAPAAWGVHPYVSVAKHELAPLLALRAALPGGGAMQLWITEIAALRCRDGEVLGDGRQAQDAAFLVERLAVDPSIAAAHVFYYGLQFRDRLPAPCSRAGGEDGELFGPDDLPRPAAAIVFPALAAAGRAAAFGPGPGPPG